MKREFRGKLYNYDGNDTLCPLITINGKVYCVMKECWTRALMQSSGDNCKCLPRDGGQIIPEAPADWETKCDLRIETGRPKPEEWI
jgi:hypothetical protein